MPRISVIVPVYKVEKYLNSCVDSILNQTLTDLEVILVDDGSPDNCGIICDEYAAKDNRVKVIHQQNGGLSCARNAGIAAATGAYFCVIDSDDYVAPEFCEVLFTLLDGTIYDYAACNSIRFQDGQEPVIKRCEPMVCSLSNADYLKLQYQKKTEFGVWNKLYRIELREKIQFAPGRLNEDVIYSADLLRHLHNGVIFTTQVLHFYRQRNNSIMSGQAIKAAPDRVYAGEYLLEAVQDYAPELLPLALRYAVDYPFSFVDPIYIKRSFRENKQYLKALQGLLKRHIRSCLKENIASPILLKRMSLFAKSSFLYGINAYTRLLRVYIFRVLKKDAYKTGHGI